MNVSLVITTINLPNKNIKKFDNQCKKKSWSFIVIGDHKTPKKFKLNYGDYFSIQNQNNLKFSFSKKCPINSYARKNIGYLAAYKNNSDVIVETDDDNYPYNSFFEDKKISHMAKVIKSKNKWVNIYSAFFKKKINCWPRGLPLNEITNSKIQFKTKKKNNFYLQQGVCEGNPDVDAIFRLINKKININFKKNLNINVKKSLVTLNSQNTIWFRKIFPLLYLPVTCTMRCTDIWRGLITQRILQNDNKDIMFFGTTMKQFRNDHNLLNDFEQEIPMYLNDKKIDEIISDLKLKKGEKNYLYNLKTCYNSLINHGIISKKEIFYLNAWISDCQKIIK